MIDFADALMLALDTGVLTLIWLVQLVIYPGLYRYSSTELRNWHPIYTKRVSWVILPLMLSQLLLSAYRVWIVPESIQIIHLSLVIIAWAITFFRAVPLHNSLEKDKEGNDIVLQLIRINWYRTLVWSIAWGISMVGVL